MSQSRIGLIVNPVAGMGGAVGLKGSDGIETQRRAARLGGVSPAPLRAGEALRALGPGLAVLTAPGAMGETLCLDHGLDHDVFKRHRPGDMKATGLDGIGRKVIGGGAAVTSGADTRAAAAAMAAAGAALILFAGGDGTARDVATGAGRTPILGIPSGVKMYSGVFAASPALAGRLGRRFLDTAPGLRRIVEADILDIDEAALRRDEAATRLFGIACVPASPAIQRAKASVPTDDAGDLDALCHVLAGDLEPACLHLVGPGTTARRFMTACGLPKTLLGVDAMRDGRLVAADCSEATILALLDAGGPARIVVGLLGGQGCLLGRGNPQLSAPVLARVGVERVTVLAGAAKLATLKRGLFVDTGDADLDRRFEGFVRVHTAPRRSTLLRVRSPSVEDRD